MESHVKSRAKLKEKEETEASLLEEAKKIIQSIKDVKNSIKLKIEKTHAAALKSIKEETLSQIMVLENSLKIRNKNNLKHEDKIKVLKEEVAPRTPQFLSLKLPPLKNPPSQHFQNYL